MTQVALPAGWQWKKLDVLGRWSGGGTPSKSKPEFWENGTVLWVSPKDMKSMYIVDSEDKITINAFLNSSAKYITPPALLFVMRSGILRRFLPVGIVEKEVTVNQDIKTLSLSKEVSPEYVYYYLQCENRHILNTCSKAGTTVESIESNLLKQTAIPVPPLPVQQAIVARIEELFSELDAGTQELKTALRRLKTYQQAVLHHFLNNPDWPRVKLGEVIKSGPQNGLYKSQDFYGSGTRIIRIDNFYDGILNAEDSFRRVKVDPNELDLYGVEEDDILINRVNSMTHIGKCAHVRNLTEDTVFESNIMRFSLIMNLANVRFIIFVLTSPNGLNELRKNAKQAVNQASINQQDVKGVEFPLPDLETQTKIVAEIEARLSEVDALEATIRQELRRAENLRQSILKQAFAGQLVSHVAEPAPGEDTVGNVPRPVAASASANPDQVRSATTFGDQMALF